MCRASSLALFAAALFFPFGASEAQQLGDVNGDGRVSFGDAFLAQRWLETGLGTFEPAPGSADFASVFECQSTLRAAYVYAEALRRDSASPLPLFIDVWPTTADEAPILPADGSVQLDVLPVEHTGPGAEVDVRVRLTSSVPLDFASLLLRVEGLDVRPAPPPLRSRMIGSSEYYLLTGGLLAFHSPFRNPRTFELEQDLILPCVLPKGTPAGSYRVELLAGTEVVISSGEVLSPRLSSALLTTTQTIRGGHSLPFPPFRFAEETRQVEGPVEIRFTDAEGSPGETVSVLLQVRAESPINRIEFAMRFDPLAVFLEETSPLYVDPELGRVVPEHHRALFLNGTRCSAEDGGYFQYRYTPVPVDTGLYQQSQAQPSLSYIAPIGEWIDLLEVRFTISPDAGRESGLDFIDTTLDSDLGAFFPPYFSSGFGWTGCESDAAFWEYDMTWTSGRISILGGAGDPGPPEPPIDPEEADIEFFIGESEAVEAEPGEVVRLPVFMHTGTPLWKIRMSFGYDTDLVELIAVDVNFRDFDGVPFVVRLEPENEDLKTARNMVCQFGPDGQRACDVGLFPFSAEIYGPPWETVPRGTVLVDVLTSFCWNVTGGLPSWDPGTSYEVGAVHFRVDDEAMPQTTMITNQEIDWQPFSFRNTSFYIHSQTQGYPFLEEENPLRTDVPAFVVRPGVIVILGESQFIRGDSNTDRNVDISDAVHTLNARFLGSAKLDCEDAADSNDDGALDLTDALYTVNRLFLGGPPIPPPFPEAGSDPTPDGLGCSGG